MSELLRYCEESGEELGLDGDYLQTPTVKEHTQGILWTESKRQVSNMQHSDSMKKKNIFLFDIYFDVLDRENVDYDEGGDLEFDKYCMLNYQKWCYFCLTDDNYKSITAVSINLKQSDGSCAEAS